jgi:hypothetical protein
MGFNTSFRMQMSSGGSASATAEETLITWSGTSATNSISFSNRSISANTGSSIAWDGNKGVAVAYGGDTAYSNDGGNSWTNGGSLGNTGFGKITYWDDKSLWLVAGQDDGMRYSNDGSSWSSGSWNNGGTYDYKDVAAGGLTLNGTTTQYAVTVGNNGETGWSTNGTSWTWHARSNSNSLDFTHITHGDGEMIAIGGRYNAYTNIVTRPAANHVTASGANDGGWDQISSDFTGAHRNDDSIRSGHAVIEYLNGDWWSAGHEFGTAGSGGWMSYAANGEHTLQVGGAFNTWTPVLDIESADYRYQIKNLAYGNGQYIAAGHISADAGTGAGNPLFGYSFDKDNWNWLENTGAALDLAYATSLDFNETTGLFTASRATGIDPNGNTTSGFCKQFPGFGSDTVSVTFDSSLASSAITYTATPNTSTAAGHDKDLYTALTQAITDGDLTGVTVTYNGGSNNGTGVKIVNTEDEDVTNITISGAGASASINTYVDN